MKNKLLLAGFSLVFYFILIFAGNFKNSVIFAGDEWEYQAIAVNHHDGHGFLTTGKIEETDRYKITDLSKDKLIFWESKSGKAYHRSPFYPLFLCLVYQIIGINPLPVKLFQLLLIFIAGLILIPVAQQAWGIKGRMIGMLGFPLFIVLNYRFAEHLMPENWQLVFISLIVYFLFFHYKNKPFYSVALGVILGISVLNKGTTLFIFPIVLFYDTYLILIHRKKIFFNTILFAISFFLITISYSVWLSVQVNKSSFVSTQPMDVILDGNNEYSSDGLWHPEWRDNRNSFYNKENVKNKQEIVKLMQFYLQYPGFLKNLIYKIQAGFISLLTIQLLLSLFLVNLGLILFKRMILGANTGRGSPESINYLITLPFPFILIFCNFLIFTLVFYVCNEVYTSRYVKTMEGIIVLSLVYYAFGIYTWILTETKLFTTKNEK